MRRILLRFKTYPLVLKDKAHYGCGDIFMDGWLNIDAVRPEPPPGISYFRANLTERHPFPSECFSFGFSEDFLEHLTQSQSLIFLSEAYRTLKHGGVLRLSFPGLEGVLKKHYLDNSYETAKLATKEAYEMWGHHHFYSRETLALVAKHIGFRAVSFQSFGESNHQELRGIDTRTNTANTWAELMK
jgi:predicted SAM-dependent methyltransferase